MRVRGPRRPAPDPAARARSGAASRKPTAPVHPPAAFERVDREAAERLNPSPRPPPPPPTDVMVNGVRVKTADSAAREAKRIVELLTMRSDVRRRLREAKAALVVVPADKKLTDMPEFESLRGKRTFDGREWDDVRGVGCMTSSDGGICCGVAEETLLHLPGDPYPKDYSVAMHELAHVIHAYGLPLEDLEAIANAYEARKAAGGPWTDSYASSNADEYFSQGTNAFFRQNAVVGENDPAWIKQNDRALYDALERIYGPPPP